MLDMMQVAGQIRIMAGDLSAISAETVPRLQAALGTWDQALALGDDLASRVKAARTSWLVAEPLEPLGAYPVGTTDPYRVVASDGSQIMPDHHEAVSCFLVNVGMAIFDYQAPSARLHSQPQVCWLPEDLYPLVGGIRQEADGRVIAARRFALECRALEAEATNDDLLLTDGTLLLWWLDTDADRLRALPPDDVKSVTLEALRSFLNSARALSAMPVGYLSGPRSSDVVSMLKVVMCTESPVDCDRCPYESGRKTWQPRIVAPSTSLLPAPTKPCEEADPLSDAALFSMLLQPGQRSSRFRSSASVTDAYDTPVDFVYFHTGSEIARLEFPAWMTPESLETMCAMVSDQCAKGMGYPVALQEAHEQAVVRAADRRAFLDLVARRAPGTTTAKLARKRRSVL